MTRLCANCTYYKRLRLSDDMLIIPVCTHPSNVSQDDTGIMYKKRINLLNTDYKCKNYEASHEEINENENNGNNAG